ncbi:MAG: hypothetical protein HY747_04900 [Elusimicrobia bacterium]|nr:hypothetical protein [Elusimicrobiota bacterium]
MKTKSPTKQLITPSPCPLPSREREKWWCLFDRRKGAFYDEWEEKNESDRQKIISKRLDEYVRHASKLPFYKERLSAYKKGELYPLAQVPPLTSQELRESLPPQSRRLIADENDARGSCKFHPHPALPPTPQSFGDGDTASGRGRPQGGGVKRGGHANDSFNVFQSGGTTGRPKTALFSHEEFEALTLPNTRGFYAVGLDKNDRAANLFAVGALYMTFLHIHRMLQQYGCMNFPFSNHAPADFVHNIMRLFKINCLAGVASISVKCLKEIASLGLEDIQIEKFYYGGEHLYEEDKQELKKKFGIKTIAAPGYGTIDTWYIGYQCSQCPTAVFHVHDDQCYTEIVNEETGRQGRASPQAGRHCAPNETGMIYATPYPRRLTPIIRYRVGDLAQWLKDPCPCGRTTPLFKLLGRGDDVLRVGYDSIDYDFVRQTVGRALGASPVVQMEKRREQGLDRLIIRIETQAESAQHPEMAQMLENKIIETRPALRKAISEGTVRPVKIEFLKPLGIPKNPRTGKLIRVIDAVSS